MRYFIIEVLAPLGDRVAQATTALILNGFAWLLAHVYLLPENAAVKTITKISIYASVLAVGVTLLYASMLGVISLLHGVPLSVVFSDAGKRRQYLKEVRAMNHSLNVFTTKTGEKKTRHPPERYTSTQVILLITALLLILVTVFGGSTWGQPLALLLMGVVIGMQIAPRLLGEEAG